MIETPRLRLIPYAFAHAQALARGRSHLALALGAALPPGWPEFAEAYSVTGRDPSRPVDEWGAYLFLVRDGSSLVGSGGYKGAPRDGLVEVGYEIAPAFRNQGYAAEATRGMVARAFARADVDAVRAHTLAGRNASVRVLEKLGFTFDGAVEDPHNGTVWRWQLPRARWEDVR